MSDESVTSTGVTERFAGARSPPDCTFCDESAKHAIHAVDGAESRRFQVPVCDDLYAVERDAKKQGQEQCKLSTCGDGCDRKQDPVITGAVRTALVDGRREGIAVLDGERLPVEAEGPDLVAATDGGNNRSLHTGTEHSEDDR